ncbi:MAG: hypothetical protein ABS98_06400 [Lysobacteraceae bacterium SCN 69-48]|nr:MAG: hypothetical protein ABS98_06400 [Xanthomonadaceae bacterium SCN 69-48]
MAVQFGEACVIAIELHDLVVLAGHQFLGLAKFHLQGLHLVFMPARLSLALLFSRLAEVLERFAGLTVFVFQRLDVGGLFGKSRFQPGGAFLQGPHLDGTIVQLRQCCFVGSLFVLQRRLGSLQAIAQRPTLALLMGQGFGGWAFISAMRTSASSASLAASCATKVRSASLITTSDDSAAEDSASSSFR